MARLILESGAEKREITLAGPVTLGRAKSATVSIDDLMLSREHTRFTAAGDGRYFVMDLESKNGTFLNGQLVRKPELLKHGDRLKAGPVLMTFLLDPEEQALEGAAKKTLPPPPAAPRPPAAPVLARARPRAPGEVVLQQPNPLVRSAYTLFLLAVVLGGGWISKGIFIWIFNQFLPAP